MYSILFLSVIAVASAAPDYEHHSHGNFIDLGFHLPGFDLPPASPFSGLGLNILDKRSPTAQLNKQLKKMGKMMKYFLQKLPASVTKAGIEGDYYKIVIPLSGYNEEEITVKVDAGVLTIQAVRNAGDGHRRTYSDVRTLPDYVDPSGSWNYADDVLTVEFPLKKSESPTVYPLRRMEEIGDDDNGALDADVGNTRDNDQDKEMETNEIPDRREQVKEPTYAVDLKDDVEFVPVTYYYAK